MELLPAIPARKALGDALQVVVDFLLSCHRTGGGDLRDGEEWKRVSAWGGREALSLPGLLSQVPLHSRYEAVQREGQLSEDVEEDPSRELSGTCQQDCQCLERKKGGCHTWLPLKGTVRQIS